MRKVGKGIAVAVLLVLSASVVKAALPTGDIQIGDKIFGDFSITGGVDPSLVTITLIGTGVSPDDWGILVQGPFTAENGGSLDFALLYTARTADGQPLIKDISQGFNLTSQGTGGTISIGETVFPLGFGVGDAVAQSTVGFLVSGDLTDPPGEAVQGDQLVINPPLAKVWITKDVSITANEGGLAGATEIIQRFSQVPEPTSFVLVGIGLAGAVTVMRRRRA